MVESAGDAQKLAQKLAFENEHLRERQRQLVEITSMLAGELDMTLLLEKIVTGLRHVTNSDAGSLYIVENDISLRFSVAQNDSKDIPFKSFLLPISPDTIAGYVAQSGEAIAFPDVYQMDPHLPFEFNADFDTKFGYRTKSMLAVPMRDRDLKVVGVVQLINKKSSMTARIHNAESADAVVLPYTDEDIEFLKILAAQAAIIIERASLYERLERLLRGFVDSLVKSIESRDRTTAGHSQRIATYMVVMAKRINRRTDEFWKDITYSSDQIRELFYASLLHDVGKIGVREHILIKANKLTDHHMEVIHLRIEMEILRDPSRTAELRDVWDFLKGVNLPGWLDDARFARLGEVAKVVVRDVEGKNRELLDAFELENLGVRRGNLTDGERKAIESHVVHSADILKKIPWTDDLKRVPIIAGTHHEKPNGKGYPHGLTKEEIPFEGRVLSTIDIFEALTAMDRPYKPAMPVAKALEILRKEAECGGLQSEIVEFFISEKVYEVITDEQRRNFTLTSDEILKMS